MEILSALDGEFSGKSYHVRTLDTWRIHGKSVKYIYVDVIVKKFKLSKKLAYLANSTTLRLLQIPSAYHSILGSVKTCSI